MSEDLKRLEFDVQIDSKVLYDYQIYHSYTGAGGLFGTCFGALLLIMFANNLNWIYLVFGIVVILYVPVEKSINCKKTVMLNPVYKKPIHYVISSEGVEVSQGDACQKLEWDGFVKAVNTKHSILLYSGKRNASIFPRKQLGEDIPTLISIIVENMDPSKVKIKW